MDLPDHSNSMRSWWEPMAISIICVLGGQVIGIGFAFWLWHDPPVKAPSLQTVVAETPVVKVVVPAPQPEPLTAPVVVEAKPSVRPPIRPGDIYQVRQGDSLASISKRVYGREDKWKYIQQANPKTLRGSKRVDIGQRLYIPQVSEFSKKRKRSAPDGYEYWKSTSALVTGYEPSAHSCAGSADGLTSIGRNAWNMSGCAVDPRLIPYGTKIKVPGHGIKIADDTGGALRRRGRRGIVQVDLRFPSVALAETHGKQWMQVDLYRKQSLLRK